MTIRHFGSQSRERIEETDYILVEHLEDGQVVLADGDVLELWVKNDGFAGYTIEIGGIGYEFVRGFASNYEV